jgi:hypothetical protein
MERMVSGPIEELDLAKPWLMDRELPAAMASDAAGQSGGLALMAFALRALYDHKTCQQRLRLDAETYRSAAFGGLAGCIARHAEKELAKLDAPAQAAMPRVFAALVRVQDQDAPTRQRAPLSLWGQDPDARRFVDPFIEARLLLADDSPGAWSGRRGRTRSPLPRMAAP